MSALFSMFSKKERDERRASDKPKDRPLVTTTASGATVVDLELLKKDKAFQESARRWAEVLKHIP